MIMKDLKKITASLYTIFMLCVLFLTSSTNAATNLKIENNLKKIIHEPFSFFEAADKQTITFHKMESYDKSYFKNKLFTISLYLIENEDTKGTITAVWKDLGTNYAYVADIQKSDLEDYKKGHIKYKELFSRIKIQESTKYR